MKFIAVVPTTLNDGTPVDAATLESILDGFAVRFGGYTSREVSGVWIDSGNRYADRSIEISVVCERSDYTDARDMVIAVGRQLGQLAMYFEVRDFDGTEIIRIN